MKTIFQCHFQILYEELRRTHWHYNVCFIFVFLQVHFPPFPALLYGRDGTDPYRGLVCFLSFLEPCHSLENKYKLTNWQVQILWRELSCFSGGHFHQSTSQPPAEGRCLNKPSQGQKKWAKVTIIDQPNQTHEKFFLKGGCLKWLSLGFFLFFVFYTAKAA